MRIPRGSGLSLICLLACVSLGRAAGSVPGTRAHLTKEELIGGWRLVAISYSGPNGAGTDPFYQPDSTGLIIYDPSGWMSVQISAPHRTAGEIAAARVPPHADAKDSRLKATAFDTYYAYFGTWDFDEVASTVTHHVAAALIPAETGLDYVQEATLDRGRLVLITRTSENGQETVRRKVWERAVSMSRKEP